MKKAFNLKGYIFGALRRIYRWWGPRKEILVKAQRGFKYQCNACNELFDKKLVQVDHIKEVIDPEIGFIGFDNYIERLFCPMENLQVLCIFCHKAKTKSVVKTRATTRKRRSKKRNR